MQKIKDFFKSRNFKIGLIGVGIFVVLFLVSISAYNFYFSNKIYPNVFIGKNNFGGLTKEKARNILESSIKENSEKDIVLDYQGKEWKDTSKNFNIEYNVNKTIDSLYLVGRDNNFIDNMLMRVGLLFKKRNLIAVFSYNKDKSCNLITDVMSELNMPSENARMELQNDQLEIINEKVGKVVNDDELSIEIIKEIGYLEDRKINIEVAIANPKITKDQLSIIKPQLEKVISEKIILKSEKKDFEIGSAEIYSWIDIIAKPSSSNKTTMVKKSRAADGEKFTPGVIVNQENIKVYAEKISEDTNQEPIDAKLTVVDGKATVFSQSRDGYELDKDKTAELVSKNLEERLKVAGINSSDNPQGVEKEIELPLSVKKPLVSDETIDRMGIKELIGRGTTNFKKSPPNRISNIKVGSSIFNGALIKPGETFSTLKTLGEISTAKGFLPELVIKEDGTKPEVGGGLCQVSTTLFRAALNSGLPITERTNHKYRVSYYEPPVGMDATIYDPAPDLKFENNTPGYILIQSSVSGTEITFEFYGTKDGRVVEISEPQIYDRTEPGEPTYKEDSSLAPGETKQVEKAHQGAKASFHYKVTKDGSVLTEKTFYSVYVAWRAIFLVGPGGQPDQSNGENQNPPPSPASTESPSPNPST